MHKLIVTMIAVAFTGTLLSTAPAGAADSRLPGRDRAYVVVAGDSIVEGAGAGKTFSWPAVLEDDCGATCKVKNVGHGNSCLVAAGCNYPTNLSDSFAREVLAEKPDLILVGIGRNDLCRAPTRVLLRGYKALRGQARVAGVPIRFATITPVNGAWPFPCEEQRVEVNTWLRTLPGTLDFEARVATPSGLLRSAYAYEDGLHLTAVGYAALGDFAARSIADRITRVTARYRAA